MTVETPGVLRYLAGDVLAKTTTDSNDLCSLAGESFPENIVRLCGLPLAAGVEVHGSVSMLRPGMNAQVGLLDHYNPTHTLRRKLVKANTNNCGVCLLRSSFQLFFEVGWVVQSPARASPEFDEQVKTHGIQQHPSFGKKPLTVSTGG